MSSLPAPGRTRPDDGSQALPVLGEAPATHRLATRLYLRVTPGRAGPAASQRTEPLTVCLAADLPAGTATAAQRHRMADKAPPPLPGHPIADRADEWIKHRPVCGALISKYQRRVKARSRPAAQFGTHAPGNEDQQALRGEWPPFTGDGDSAVRCSLPLGRLRGRCPRGSYWQSRPPRSLAGTPGPAGSDPIR